MFKNIIRLNLIAVVIFISFGNRLQADDLDVLYGKIASKFSHSILLTDFGVSLMSKIDRVVINISSFELYACKGREIIKVY